MQVFLRAAQILKEEGLTKSITTVLKRVNPGLGMAARETAAVFWHNQTRVSPIKKHARWGWVFVDGSPTWRQRAGHFMTHSQAEMYYAFKAANPTIKMGPSSFRLAKPFYVRQLLMEHRVTCCCDVCEKMWRLWRAAKLMRRIGRARDEAADRDMEDEVVQPGVPSDMIDIHSLSHFSQFLEQLASCANDGFGEEEELARTAACQTLIDESKKEALRLNDEVNRLNALRGPRASDRFCDEKKDPDLFKALEVLEAAIKRVDEAVGAADDEEAARSTAAKERADAGGADPTSTPPLDCIMGCCRKCRRNHLDPASSLLPHSGGLPKNVFFLQSEREGTEPQKLQASTVFFVIVSAIYNNCRMVQ